MGKKFRGNKNRRGGGGGGGRGGGTRSDWREYPTPVKENVNLQRYYDGLLALPEEEKTQYWDALKRELPNSFRFCGSKGHALAVKRLLQTRYIPEIVNIEHQDGRPVEPPKPVPWYPDELAWWMTTPKNVIRKFPPFAAFQKFLVSETSVGNISRQEVVSMIPPLLMDVRPGHVVLDMCAAPGSKAAQLLEMIHQGEEARVKKCLRSFAEEDGLVVGKETEEEAEVDLEADATDAGRATGLLVANDSDYKRGHMLVHQLKRLSSPNLMVTNHDATQFPSIKLPNRENPKKHLYLKFDRILADVPCSGDGTLRKNANLWKDWVPGSALGLHLTQIRILVRALQLLKVGGKVVYSTCSMNPVENEAVVAAAIARCGGLRNVEIADSSDKLPQLKRVPGMKSWSIMDKAGRIWNSWEEVDAFAKKNDGVIPGRVVQSMFPAVGDDAEALPLDRCMRVYPHLQDTGGFFITVLEKKAEFKARNENDSKLEAKPEAKPTAAATEDKPAEVATEEAKEEERDVTMDTDETTSNGNKRTLEEADESGEQQPAAKKTKTDGDEATTAKATETEDAPAPVEAASAPAAEAKASRRNGPQEEPFIYLDASHPVIQNIKEFYKISPRFPDDRYMVRNAMGEPAKAIYYTTALMRDIFTENEGRGIKFVHGGVRMYMKQDAPSADVCRWRVQSEGIPILQGYVGESRLVHLTSKETFRRLLIEMFPRIADGAWRDFAEIGERVRDIGMGCCVLRVQPDGSDPDFQESMALPLWKSIHSLNLMLPKEDRSAMLLRVFNDTSPLVNITLKKQQEQKKLQEAGAGAGAAEDDEDESAVDAAVATEDAPAEDVPVEDAPADKAE
ncbi:multisite-specific tRNA:(cytosine-C5)-methyltransferase [Geosmithia morbida]|uniref:Multisite-specific tRNA:(Cytosine-C5)-methyltransferase n=1 Tax=Geosmithia morbida TaxID=1094350 RepID=A0A9P4Z1X3_9HYPO|nr:multisite-specific tRNA:(cytosine-C5)-methyltransferase [Geosmithia morbida]KAF4126642.1 multisite-specific tRNA:(cytosine-C5)-methyltransferase [Geosmithia morbida]